jgi:predicted DNA-binding transcriptional regulator AlpA
MVHTVPIRIVVDPEQVRQALEAVKHPENPSNRLVRAGNIVSSAEIATTLGVTRTRVTTWISRRTSNGFPLPLRTFEGGQHCWDVDEVKQWYQAWTANHGYLGEG